MKSWLILLVAASLTFLLGAAESWALEVPQLKGRINDYAGVISNATETQLENSLQALESTDSTQIVVLTVSSLEGDSLEAFSLKVAETWKIGQQGIDNGALLLVAIKERKVRIETGYGLEGSLTDLVAGRIIRNIILPRFREGNIDRGIIEGVTAMSGAVKGEFNAGKSGKSSSKEDDPAGFIAMILFAIFFFANLLRRSKVASGIAGGIVTPVLGMILLGLGLPMVLALIPLGVILGILFTLIPVSSGRGGRSMVWGSGGGFSGSSGGFGGFSGGGGGFGGGGASGGW